MVRFSGDCDAVAKELLTLEPLAQKIRAGGAELERMSEAERNAFGDRMKTAGGAALAKIDAQLKALGATHEDLDRQEAAMKQKCESNVAFKDANERVGLKKKR